MIPGTRSASLQAEFVSGSALSRHMPPEFARADSRNDRLVHTKARGLHSLVFPAVIDFQHLLIRELRAGINLAGRPCTAMTAAQLPATSSGSTAQLQRRIYCCLADARQTRCAWAAPLARLASPCRFDRRVQRQQIRLAGNFVDQTNHIADLGGCF